jgi:hypothetical protein
MIQALNAAYGSVGELARGFLGPQHFGCMARLLGYGGVAVCFDEMLKLVQHEVRAHVCVCVCMCMCV